MYARECARENGLFVCLFFKLHQGDWLTAPPNSKQINKQTITRMKEENLYQSWRYLEWHAWTSFRGTDTSDSTRAQCAKASLCPNFRRLWHEHENEDQNQDQESSASITQHVTTAL